MVKKEVEARIWNNLFGLAKDLTDIAKDEVLKSRGLPVVESSNERTTDNFPVPNSSNSSESSKVGDTKAPTGIPEVEVTRENKKKI
jgi:hypothetical protein